MKSISEIYKSNRYIIIVALITIAGTVLRLYKFPYMPDFTDEVRESVIAYDLYFFKKFPITNFSDYIGSVYLYMLAYFMHLFPFGIWTPRIFSLVSGILLIPLSYYFGKKWAGNRVGVFTALYVALSPTLILINSRVAWSNCFTPLFTVLSLISLKSMMDKFSVYRVFIFAFITIITIQLHPLMFLFAIPTLSYAFIWVIIKKFNRKEAKCSFVDILKKFIAPVFIAGLIALAPLIIINLKDPLAPIEDGVRKENFSYSSLNQSPEMYLANLSREIAQTKHLLRQSVIFESYVIPEYQYYPHYMPKHPNDIFVFLLIIGMVFIILKKKWSLLLFPLLIGFYTILAPFLTTDYFDGLKIRYYAFLIPIFALVMAYGIDETLKIKLIRRRKFVEAFLLIFVLIVTTYVPLKNFYDFSLVYDTFIDVRDDMGAIKDLSRNKKIYYIDPASRDYEAPYGYVEFLIKFGEIKPRATHSINDNLPNGSNAIFVLPKKINYVEDDLLWKKIIDEKKLVYDGDTVNIYFSEESRN